MKIAHPIPIPAIKVAIATPIKRYGFTISPFLFIDVLYG
jgi:hypothetical protein